MKIKTVVISVVVSAALVAGAGYGAYYAINGQKTPVQVVPVSNINNGYWGDMGDSIYGSITSQVAQIVNLNDEYSIDEIYVEEGDKVKEGDPLFAYDMTLQELELEMEQLTLQTKELTLTKLEKDLEKYKRGEVDDGGSLDDWDDSYTASADTEPLAEESSVSEGTIPASEPVAGDAGTDAEAQDDLLEESAGESAGDQADSQSDPAQDGLQVEDVEVVSESGEENFTTVDSVVSFEQLVAAIDALFTAYGDDLKPEEVGSAINDAVSYFRKNLASEQVTSVTDENGEPREQHEYVIKDEVRTALGEEAAGKLEQYVEKLNVHQVKYVEMLIGTTDTQKETMGPEEFQTALSEIQEAYELLATSLQNKVGNLSVWQELQSYEPADTTSRDEVLEDAQDTSGLNAGEDEGENPGESGEDNPQSESGEPESQPGTEQSYTVTLKLPDGEMKDTYKPGDTVKLTAPTADLMMIFQSWTLKTSEGETAEIENIDLKSGTIEFAMPEYDVIAVPSYEPNGDRIEKYVRNFLNMAEDITSKTASKESEYFNMFETAIDFYQSWLAIPDGASAEEVMDGTATGTMESYTLKRIIADYLTAKAGDTGEGEIGDPDAGEQTEQNSDLVTVAQLEETYEKLCKDYVLALYKSVNANASNIDKGVLDRALAAYEDLGDNWKKSLEEQWKTDSENTGSRGIWDGLKAYAVLQKFQDYQKRKDSLSEEEREALLQELLADYNSLTEVQKAIVAANQDFVNDVLNTVVTPPETEPETTDFIPPETDMPDPGDGGWDDGWDDGSGDGYSASEIQEMIEAKEREIKNCKLEIRETELSVSQKQRIVDGKVVKSTMEGTVISIGNPDGESDYDYFAKIANETGLYAKGVMNELALEQIKVGDTISGMQTDTGVSFTAVIKEISEYPDPNGSNMYYGSGNSNASYYPFYAKLDNTDDIEEGEAEIQLSDTMSSDMDAIYLDKSFVRTGNDGKSYVYKQGEDGTLTKQYVTTGKVIYSFAVEIISGLTLEDKIAFPYGKNVTEGAPTKEVDMLDNV